MNLSSKVTLLFSAIALGILAMLVAISLYAFRSFSISSSSAHVRTAAEVVRVHLTEAMIQGTIAHREQFLARLMEVQGLSMARVVRSPLVDQQFGVGLVRELPADEIEKAVLASGEPRYVLREVNGDTLFRG
ncbi:MAG TPA: diguanylate cyclase, partial [Pseudothauera hydrothermalis]|nr:diguanylate cyclase [Pseudothauera hydrothermalis]